MDMPEASIVTNAVGKPLPCLSQLLVLEVAQEQQLSRDASNAAICRTSKKNYYS